MALREGQKAKALFDYEARAPDELSFKRRDIITVLDKDEDTASPDGVVPEVAAIGLDGSSPSNDGDRDGGAGGTQPTALIVTTFTLGTEQC